MVQDLTNINIAVEAQQEKHLLELDLDLDQQEEVQANGLTHIQPFVDVPLLFLTHISTATVTITINTHVKVLSAVVLNGVVVLSMFMLYNAN